MVEFMFKFFLMEVLLVLEEYLRRLEEGSASNEASDNTSNDSKT
jgi:hypothetical protein